MARLTFRRPEIATARPQAGNVRTTARWDSRDGAAANDTDTAVGPGWFESTFDLWHGLDVREEDSAPRWHPVLRCGGSVPSAGRAWAA